MTSSLSQRSTTESLLLEAYKATNKLGVSLTSKNVNSFINITFYIPGRIHEGSTVNILHYIGNGNKIL